MRTKDFIYYASAAVLMVVTTQVASADEVATQMPTVTEGNQYQPATAADIFGGGAVLAQESPSARPSSTVAETPYFSSLFFIRSFAVSKLQIRSSLENLKHSTFLFLLFSLYPSLLF